MTLCLAMYAPLARNSFARVGSTRDTQLVTRLTLSLGVNIPQLEHWTSSLLPLPPLLRPLDLRFFGVLLTNPIQQLAILTTNSLLSASLPLFANSFHESLMVPLTCGRAILFFRSHLSALHGEF